ncbi:hypothetical protein C0971_14700 [Bacillus methanolicus]|uniref:cupredoxin domain-containing protein n=1 Tax=Bacillus methanolicus TaxID=1471 RepID=UPI003D80AA23|nr:hypothetical protein C0971_14700 [Bacillus methanolicus]
MIISIWKMVMKNNFIYDSKTVQTKERVAETIISNSFLYIKVKSLKPGTYHYACGMNMHKGTVTVVK